MQARDNHPVIAAVRHVIHAEEQRTVRELADQYSLSERQFERKFKEYAGFTPKLYQRIVRFERACERYGGTAHRTLTGIAHACGYYDQSHFIRDFKAFSGYCPRDVLLRSVGRYRVEDILKNVGFLQYCVDLIR